MDYEKKYKEALEKARQLCAYPTTKPFISDLQDLFPELKESEDERIRKELIDYIKSKFENSCSPTPSKNILGNWLAWLEKQGEQKYTDKVKPKFNVGDWIIFNGLTLYINEVVKGYYRTISKGGIPNSYDWDIDNAARRWTIQDAKDGDVLVHSSFMFDDFIFIYNNTSILQAYCYYSNNINSFIVEDRGHYCPWNMQEVKPTTKEQRNTLFAKMKEAGYKWNEDKKELIKL